MGEKNDDRNACAIICLVFPRRLLGVMQLLASEKL